MEQSVYLTDKNKTLSFSEDMDGNDINLNLQHTEYKRPFKDALLNTIVTMPGLSKVFDYALNLMPLEEWDRLGQRAKDVAMAIPKFAISTLSTAGGMATSQDTAEEEKNINDSAKVLGEETLRSIVRVYEYKRPLVRGIARAGEQPPLENIKQTAEELIKTTFKPEETPKITEQIPFQDWEQSAFSLIPRAIATAIEDVAVYTLNPQNIKNAIDNYQISKVQKNINLFAERMKNKIMEIGYTEDEAIKILLDPRTQNFIRQTPIFQRITGQGITKIYGGTLPPFKIGDVVQIGKETAEILRIEGKNAVLKIAGKELLKPLTELPQPTGEGKVLFKGVGGEQPNINQFAYGTHYADNPELAYKYARTETPQDIRAVKIKPDAKIIDLEEIKLQYAQEMKMADPKVITEKLITEGYDIAKAKMPDGQYEYIVLNEKAVEPLYKPKATNKQLLASEPYDTQAIKDAQKMATEQLAQGKKDLANVALGRVKMLREYILKEQALSTPTGEGRVPPTEPPPTAISGAPEPKMPFKRRERGFISSIKEELPELRVGGQYVPRTTDRLAIKARNLIKDDIKLAEQIATTETTDKAIAIGAELLKYYSNEALKATSEAVKDAIYEKSAELGNTLAKKLTDLGRSVQAAAILGRLTPEGQIRFAAKTIQKYNQEVEQTKGGLLGLRKKIPELSENQAKYIIEATNKIAQMPDGQDKAMMFKQLQEYISDLIPTPLLDKIITIWKAGLLTGLKTSGLNTFANISHFGTEIIKDIPAVMVDSVVSLFTKQRTLALSLKGIGGGLKEGFDKGWRFLKTGYDERNVLTKFDYKRVSFGTSKLAKGLQAYEETVFKLMGAEDQPFYYGAKARSLYNQAKSQAINKGLKGNEVKSFIDNLVANPTDEMLLLATSDAEICVFQNATELSKAAGHLRKIPFAEFVIPFTRTPSAVAMQIVNYSPVGIAKTIATNVGKGKFSQRGFSQGLGRGLTGTALLFLGALMFRKGMIALDRPKSETEKKMWELEGKQANSILIGGKYRTIQILGPAGNVLLAGAQFQNAFDKSGSISMAIGQGTFSSIKSFTEQTFVKGISTSLGALTEPDKQAEYFFSSLISSFVPTLVADIGRSTDKIIRRPENIIQKVMERVPLLREQLEPRVDVFGREVMRKENFLEILADPSRPSTSINEPVTQELRRLIDEGNRIYITQLGDKEGYKVLTQEQNTDLWQRSGQMAYDKISSFMDMPVYDDLPDETRVKEINKILDKAKKVARVEKVIEITKDLDGGELKQKLSEAKKDGLINKDIFNLYLKHR